MDSPGSERETGTMPVGTDLSEFYLDVLGHDIGNIHQGILSWIQIAMSRREDPEELMECLDNAYVLLLHAISVARNARLHSRMRDCRVDLETIHLERMIIDAFQRSLSLFPETEMNLSLEDRNTLIEGERFLEEAFFNLFSASIMSHRSIPGTLKVRIDRTDEDKIIVDISDPMMGLTHDVTGSIPVSEISMDSRLHSGMGLQLAKGILDRNRERISVRIGNGRE